MTFEFDRIRDILVCPRSKSELVLDGDTLVSTSPDARLQYPIVEEIPRLLVDEAQQLSVEAWGRIMQKAGRDPQTGRPVAA
jgi:uncharacterized protein YbaR (Trm112 family)